MQNTQHFNKFTTFQLLKIDMSSDAFRICVFLLEKSFYKNGILRIGINEIADGCHYKNTNRNIKISIPSYLLELEKLKIISIKKEKGSLNTYTLLDLDYAKNFNKKEKQIEIKKESKMEVKNTQNRPLFCDEISAKWVSWRRARGLENAFPLEEYSTHIYNSYHLIPNQNYEFWMNKIFEHIQTSDFWGNQGACDTPHQLSKKMNGTYKIVKIYQELNSSKNKKKIIKEHISNTVENNEEYKQLSEEMGF